MNSFRRVTVFGGSGFIGRYVVQRLARRGAVIAVVGPHASRAKELAPMGDVGQIALINASLMQEDRIREAVAGADAVVNLVGILTEQGRQRFDRVHHEGAALVARVAAEAGVRKLVHVSAIGADPRSPSRYARSKAEGERAVRQNFPAATILRPSIVFGPEDDFFNRFARMAGTSPILPLIGGGGTRFQPVYVGDVADAVLAALDQASAAGQTYELGGPRIYTFRELMELLLQQIEPRDDDTILRRHALIELPFPLATSLAAAMGVVWSLPFVGRVLGPPPLTRDQVTLLRRDNVVSVNIPGFDALGIDPTAAELILPTYLARFRPGGWYAARPTA